MSMTIRVVTACVLAAGTAWAQPPAVSDQQALGRGWAALAAGRSDQAVSVADDILKRKPRSHAALSLKIEALSSGAQPLMALNAYEEWLINVGRNVEDRGVLEPVAAGMLRTLARGPDPRVSAAALQSLADAGDDTAIQALRKQSAGGDQSATFALASLGDPGAITTLQTLVEAGNGRDNSAAIAALAEHGAVTPHVIGKLLRDRVPMNRAAAVRALAASTSPDAAQQLDQLNSDPDPLVRTSATLARAKLGDAKALDAARAMLLSDVPDLRLMAAEVLSSVMPLESDQAVRPLLTNRDGLIRFRAAALVGRTDPSAVTSILAEGLSDENPLIQEEAARVVAMTVPGDLALLRKLLRHTDRSIVAMAAAAIIGG